MNIELKRFNCVHDADWFFRFAHFMLRE